MSGRRIGGAAVMVTLIAAAGLPATAPAASVTITGDAGAPVALNPAAPPTLRQMRPTIDVALTAGRERSFQIAAAGPGDAPAAPDRACATANVPWGIDYLGNGDYVVTVTTYASPDCSGRATATRYGFRIAAGVRIENPTERVLIRAQNDFNRVRLALPIDLNPGALTTEVRVARGGELAPDGAISGPTQRVTADATSRTVALDLRAPGAYLLVARAAGFSGAISRTQAFSPWSEPVRFRAYAPFDFVDPPAFPDGRGPRYRLRVDLNEKSATGRVLVRIARGRGRFRRVGRARIRGGSFQQRFTARKPGLYRLRFTYRGNRTTAPGTVTTTFRIEKPDSD